jgi:hypothetical protein
MKVLYSLFMLWPGGQSYLIATDLDIYQCAGKAAMERLADERWRFRCQPQANAFKSISARETEQ